ncbi:MAG: ATP-binding protein [Breznakibacter sp.]
MYSGIAKCVYNNGKLNINSIQAGNSETNLSDNSIRALVEDNQGIVWIATSRGLNRLDPATGHILKFRYDQNDTTSINDNIINVLFTDQLGNLWIGTSSGLNKKIETTNKDGQVVISFKNYPNQKYINNDLITNLIQDKNDKIWVGLYSGMLRFDPKTETIEQEYFVKDYQRLGYERNTSYADLDGNLFLGGQNGFLSFHPDKLVSLSQSPKVVLTDLLIYNEKATSQTYSANEPVLAKPMPFTKSITLAYSDNVFTLAFSAMDFKDSKKNEYAYFLDGFDRQWNEVGTRNTATYTGIPPGEYVFKVKACNSDKVWSQETTELKITILPPWWKTWYAYLLYAFIMLALLYVFKQYSVQQLKQRNALTVEKLNFEKEHELNEMKSQFFTNITHEFRTPLSLILGPTNELLVRKDMPPVVTKQALLIQKSAQRLLRLVNQLIEFRRVEKENLQLYIQQADVVPLVEDAYESFLPMAETRHIRLELQKKQPNIVAQIDVDKFDKIMFNLLSNAFKFTEDGGTIQIRVDLADNVPSMFYVEIEDTGIGIPADKKELIFNRFYQINQAKSQSTGGIGLYLSKAFVQQHSGTIDVESEPGKGSIFKVVLPLNNGQSAIYQHITDKDKETVTAQRTITQAENEDPEESLQNNLPLLLVVEDDHDMNDFIATGLENEFTVVSCFNGKEGIEQAKKLLPDLILSDVMMPELNGFEFCKQLRKDINTSHIPLMFLTAKTMKDDEIKGLRLGAVDYITKPFDLTTLRLKLTNVLQTKKSLQEKLRTNMILEPEEIELTSLDEEFLKDVVDAVNKNLDNPEFDVELLSKEVALSPNQVYRKIKSLTGQTAKEFIRSQRLKTAASMLLQKKRSISEIIYMVGFSSPSYFARCFKEHFGCTPSEYMERNP